jgi:hypothetical protein
MILAGWLRLAVVAILLAFPAMPAVSQTDEPPDGRTAAAYEALGDFFAADTPSRDEVKAIDNYEKAGAAGSATAFIKLARLLVAQPGDTVALRAAEALRDAIALGAAGPAGDALGDLYRNDPRLRDLVQALAAYGTALDAGEPGVARKVADILLTGGVEDAARVRAVAALERAVGGPEAVAAAFQLAQVYHAGATRSDMVRARRNYEIAAAGGLGEAHLALAELQADRVQDPRIRRDMLDHYLAAATLLDVATVAVRMSALPQPTLLALVRDLVIQRGLGVLPLSGPNARNPDVVAAFCRSQARYYCSERSVPWEMLIELIGGSTAPR